MITLFAPHVGIDRLGNVGQYERYGQDFTTNTCGAAVGAYNAIKAGGAITAFDPSGMDNQMDAIKYLLQPKVCSISEAENPMAQLTFETYDIIKRKIEGIVNMNWASSPDSKHALLGGIIINLDDGKDRFLPLMFEVRH